MLFENDVPCRVQRYILNSNCNPKKLIWKLGGAGVCTFVKGRFREILIHKRIVKRMINPVIINRFSLPWCCGQSKILNHYVCFKFEVKQFLLGFNVPPFSKDFMELDMGCMLILDVISYRIRN